MVSLLFLCLGVDHDALVKLAENHFSGLRSTYETHDKLTPCRYTGSEVCLQRIVTFLLDAQVAFDIILLF